MFGPILLIISLVLVPLFGGNVLAIADVQLRQRWLLLVAAGLQLLIFVVIPHGPTHVLATMHVLSYLAAGGFVYFNRRLPGIWLLGFGGALNALVIAANDGTLPASRAALASAGLVQPSGVFLNSGVVPHPHFAFLGDQFVIPSSWPLHNVFSPGDIFIVAGAIYGLHRLCGCWPWSLLVDRVPLAPDPAARRGCDFIPAAHQVRQRGSARHGQPGGIRPLATTLAARVTELSTALQVPDIRRLWLAQCLSEIGDWIGRLALAVLVLDRTGSPALVSLVVTMSYLPYLASPVATAYVERFPRRTVMIGCDLVRFLLFAALVLPMPVGLLLLVAFVAGLATGPFEAVRATTVAEICPEPLVANAQTLGQLTTQMAIIVGSLIAGVVITRGGVSPALLTNAGSFAVSAVLLAGIRQTRSTGALRKVTRQLRATLSVIVGQSDLRRAIGLTVLVAPCTIVPEALVVVAARQVHASTAVGVLAAVTPLAAVLGGMLVPRNGRPSQLLRFSAIYTVGGCGVAAVLFLLSHNLPITLLAFFAVGAAIAASTPNYVVAMRVVPAPYRGTMLSLVQSVLMGGQALGAALGGMLATWGATRACGLALLPALAYALFAVVTPVANRGPARTHRVVGRRSAVKSGSVPTPRSAPIHTAVPVQLDSGIPVHLDSTVTSSA